MGIGFFKVVRAINLVEKLGERKAINKDDKEAMLFYLYSIGNYDRIVKIYESQPNNKTTNRGMSKLLFQPGYFAEIERKIQDHIIPFAENKRFYSIFK